MENITNGLMFKRPGAFTAGGGFQQNSASCSPPRLTWTPATRLGSRYAHGLDFVLSAAVYNHVELFRFCGLRYFISILCLVGALSFQFSLFVFRPVPHSDRKSSFIRYARLV